MSHFEDYTHIGTSSQAGTLMHQALIMPYLLGHEPVQAPPRQLMSTTSTHAQLENSRMFVGSTSRAGNIKLSVGGGSRDDPSPVGFGGLFSDETGVWIVGYIGKLHSSISHVAMVWSIFIGLQILSLQDFYGEIVETDSEVAMELINGANPENMQHQHLIHQTKLCLLHSGCTLRYAPKDENMCAHVLANMGADQPKDIKILDEPPAQIRAHLDGDRIRYSIRQG